MRNYIVHKMKRRSVKLWWNLRDLSAIA